MSDPPSPLPKPGACEAVKCIYARDYKIATTPVLVDVNGDGQADSTTPTRTVTLSTIQPVWEAGARLAYTSPGDSCTTINAGTSSCQRSA